MNLSNLMQNGVVAVRFQNKHTGEFTGNEYSYITAIPLKVGQLVNVRTKYGVSLAKITRVNVDPMQIPLQIRNALKTITAEDLPRTIQIVEKSEQLMLTDI